jgi:singapore isolate B (sub-type 7) whole genome shotgun sequence assembly, scaffold_0
MEYNEMNITLPMTENLLKNGTLFAHIFFGMADHAPTPQDGCKSKMGMTHTIYRRIHLTG